MNQQLQQAKTCWLLFCMRIKTHDDQRTPAWVHSWPGCTLVSGSEDTGTFCKSYRSEYAERSRQKTSVHNMKTTNRNSQFKHRYHRLGLENVDLALTQTSVKSARDSGLGSGVGHTQSPLEEKPLERLIHFNFNFIISTGWSHILIS